MVDSYLSPCVISFINYFYSFMEHWGHYIEMDIDIRDKGFNMEDKQLKITLTEGRDHISKIYNIKDIDVGWTLDALEDEVGNLLKKIYTKKEGINDRKIET